MATPKQRARAGARRITRDKYEPPPVEDSPAMAHGIERQAWYQSVPPDPPSSLMAVGWTINTFALHTEALRAADMRFDTERDRRYAEVNVEKEKALKIKETADLAALGLAREIQTYKDEKANELREQISSERGLYASKNDLQASVEKIEATLKPIAEYISQDRGKNRIADPMQAEFLAEVRTLMKGQAVSTGKGQGVTLTWGVMTTIVLALAAALAIVEYFQPSRNQPSPQMIYVPATPGTLLPSLPPSQTVPR